MDNIKDVINDVIGKIASKTQSDQSKISRIWENIVTEQEKKHTQLAGIKDGILMVIVDSPGWHYQLRAKKRKLLERMQSELAEVKNIYFKIGKVE